MLNILLNITESFTSVELILNQLNLVLLMLQAAACTKLSLFVVRSETQSVYCKTVDTIWPHQSAVINDLVTLYIQVYTQTGPFSATPTFIEL